ncbi:MAG TPA: glycerophosphodiester phosphodiesterase [Flavisolibacter sp.]|nr:glycerophosphodiester phosphodiesterase [Flavisolibacter sp.]
MKYFFLLTSLAFLVSCRKTYEAPIPDLDWDSFNSSAAVRLQNRQGQKTEGIYSIDNGALKFGGEAAVKWSYTAIGSDTTYHLSFFCQKDVSYFLCEGKRVDSSILLNGYWRRLVGTETGRVRLTITKQDGGAKILSALPLSAADNIIMTGVYGDGEAVPEQPIQLRKKRPLFNATPFEIIAHRGGGRTSDLLPVSENSVEIIRMAASLGATGVEIDVRLTSDGVPVLYHDGTLNERLIQKNGMLGPIENYSYAQLSALVRLIKGERIPTLREALNAVVYNTPLRFVWLDTKYVGSLQKVRDLQLEFSQKATAIGRTVNLAIGLPDKDAFESFKRLQGYQNIPSVNELTREEVREVNSPIWAPRFTLGLQNAEVDAVHAEGRKAFVWTLDLPGSIGDFLTNGRFDGILSNYPSAVAYNYYAKQ